MAPGSEEPTGRVAGIDRLGEELQSGGDDLFAPTVARGRTFFLSPDDPVVPVLGRVSLWVVRRSDEPGAATTSRQAADHWPVAHARAHDLVVLADEQPSDPRRKIKIPNACIGLGLTCISPYDMLRRERARFVLGPAPTAA